jgi:cytochrome P450
MSSSIAIEVDSFILRLRKLADGKTVLEMDKQVFFYTIRVISSVAFGEMSQECHEYFFSQNLIGDLNSMLVYVLARGLFPFPAFFWDLTPQSKTEDEASRGNTRLSKYCMKMITQKKEANAINASHSSTGRTSLLDNMIGTKLGGESPLTDYEIMGNVKVFFLAGSDTTSVTLSWCLYHLCVDAELQKAMQKEVDGILSLNVTGAEAIAAIPHLPLCSACFKESLRLKPPAEVLIFEPLDETVELSNGVEVKLGDELWVNISVIMLDPKVFSKPLEFRPSRWLETLNTPEKLAEMNASFTAFGHGPRVCPGQVKTLISFIDSDCYDSTVE